ncbi:uncharacterized protein DUF1080 [Roseimicrobium gellanilyticum]|uniref:Uncharacterized protein DUF1080 n=1 Tax=Roseimicrobium gellanilyticum TaxID=748857 RepID=A0A366HMX2_9BACT|nr:DUF1080 domain-containing protein [Roseimicrobium gellanilyticum]RBP44508.1 uncharacterized protein DUF1080 [Roseimicrobium gellanilyticum]
MLPRLRIPSPLSCVLAAWLTTGSLVPHTFAAEVEANPKPKPEQKTKGPEDPPNPPAVPHSTTWQHEELRRFPAKEANQGVAVDDAHIYVISNSAIGKYRKDTFEKVTEWKQPKSGPLIHMNAGITHEGKLYCAHSNFPGIPMTSSIEVWDASTMQHVDSHSLGIDMGSLTWIEPQKDGTWLACFAHYSKDKPRTGRDPSWTELVKFDSEWRRTGGWVFPATLTSHFGGSSCSGGAHGPEGQLYVTGHTWRELYVLKFPTAGSVLEWIDTIPITAEGQAFDWDPKEPGIFYGIIKRTQEVVISRISKRTDTAKEGTTQTKATDQVNEVKEEKVDAKPANTLSEEEQRLGFVSIFNGTSTEGWEQKGNWVIDADGAFYRKEKGGDLTYKAAFVPDDFELRFEWKVSKGCNSGVYYRPAQYEYQVLDNVNSPYGENPRQAAASLFFCMAPSKDATKPLGEWNTARIVGKGTVIQHWLNEEKVLDFDYTDPKWAKEIELLRIRGADLSKRGANIKLQDHGQDVWFRNLRWRTIPADEKLTASPDFTPMPIPPAALEKENARVQQMLNSKRK